MIKQLLLCIINFVELYMIHIDSILRPKKYTEKRLDDGRVILIIKK